MPNPKPSAHHFEAGDPGGRWKGTVLQKRQRGVITAFWSAARNATLKTGRPEDQKAGKRGLRRPLERVSYVMGTSVREHLKK
jgi:hypothetical protein